jgi:hypothetical protein
MGTKRKDKSENNLFSLVCRIFVRLELFKFQSFVLNQNKTGVFSFKSKQNSFKGSVSRKQDTPLNITIRTCDYEKKIHKIPGIFSKLRSGQNFRLVR